MVINDRGYGGRNDRPKYEEQLTEEYKQFIITEGAVDKTQKSAMCRRRVENGK